MATGTVKWFNRAKGFGYIKDSVSGDELYVHFSMITEQPQVLKANDAVTFDVGCGVKCPQAIDVRKA